MKKIPTLFVRDMRTKLVTPEVMPGCEWVAHGEGRATRKLDGTCCLVRAGKLYKRYEVKPGGTPPPDFEDASGVDPETGKVQGWVPVGDGPEDRWHREAFYGVSLADGTYELLGPKVQGNPEGCEHHVLIAHGAIVIDDAPRTFEGLRVWLDGRDVEGIVWHHPDGKMAKLKGRDLGLRRPAKTPEAAKGT
jgi:hypothetical protein